MNVIRPGADSAERAYVNNPSAGTVSFHLPRAFLATKEGRLEIHAVNEVPVRLADIEGVETREARSIVHQAIYRAEPLADIEEKPADLIDACEISLKDGSAIAFTGGPLRFLAGRVVMNRYVEAATRQFNRDDPADTLGRACDQNTTAAIHCQAAAANSEIADFVKAMSRGEWAVERNIASN